MITEPYAITLHNRTANARGVLSCFTGPVSCTLNPNIINHDVMQHSMNVGYFYIQCECAVFGHAV